VDRHEDIDVIAQRNNYITNSMISPLGGNRSVRLDPTIKTRLCFGQDDAIFRIPQLTESYWNIDGETTLRTKGFGTGIMVSAIVSRAFWDQR